MNEFGMLTEVIPEGQAQENGPEGGSGGGGQGSGGGAGQGGGQGGGQYRYHAAVPDGSRSSVGTPICRRSGGGGINVVSVFVGC